MAQQTAVEWLIEKIQSYQIQIDMYNRINIDVPKYMIEQAKNMEKNDIIESYEMGKNDGWNVRENDYNKNYHKEGTGLQWYHYRFKYVYGQIKKNNNESNL